MIWCIGLSRNCGQSGRRELQNTKAPLEELKALSTAGMAAELGLATMNTGLDVIA